MSDAARRAGATEVIEGEATQSEAGLVFTLRRVGLDRGVVLKGYTVRAPDIYELVDSATAAIVRDLRLPVPHRGVVDVRTPSREAYALYEEGLRALYGYDGAAAYRLMKAALEHDSTFAMAAYFAWQAGRGLVDEGVSGQDMERSRRLAPRASERERLLIQGSIAALDASLSVSTAIAETLSVRFRPIPTGRYSLDKLVSIRETSPHRSPPTTARRSSTRPPRRWRDCNAGSAPHWDRWWAPTSIGIPPTRPFDRREG
jgi:hypothetical protein